MKKIIFFTLVVLLYSCSNKENKGEEQNKPEVEKKDTIVKQTFIERLTLALGEKQLSSKDTSELEFRYFYICPTFEGPNQFYKIQYTDSVLIRKTFLYKDPTGSGVDTLLTTSKFKLDKEDFSTIDYLVEKSMLWSLEEKEVFPVNYLDCNYIVYEIVSQQFIGFKKMRQYKKAERQCSQNIDFLNLGEFFKHKAGEKSYYKKIEYWK